MANDTTNLLKHSLLPNAIGVLRENARMARLVWNDFRDEEVKQNQKVVINIPGDLGDPDDMNFTTENTAKNIAPLKAELSIDYWKEYIIAVTDKEIEESMISGHLPVVLEDAVKGLANSADKALLNLGKDVYNFSGTAGTTPQTVAAYTGLRKAMNDALIPDDIGARRLVIDTAAEEKYNQLFYNVQTVGNVATLENGALVRKFNMDIMMDQNVQYMTNGTATSGTIGTCLAGASTCDLTVGIAETIKKGQLFTAAGVTQQFVATADFTADGGGAIPAFTFAPAAPEALTGKAITFIASHRMNLAFTRKAFAIAWRPIASTQIMGVMNTNSVRQTMIDPISGIPLTMEMWRDPGIGVNKIAMRQAFGVVTSDARRGVRFLG